jgi:hypothetical protein
MVVWGESGLEPALNRYELTIACFGDSVKEFAEIKGRVYRTLPLREPYQIAAPVKRGKIGKPELASESNPSTSRGRLV